MMRHKIKLVPRASTRPYIEMMSGSQRGTLCEIPVLCRLTPELENEILDAGQANTLVIGPSEGRCGSALIRSRLDYTVFMISSIEE